MYDRDGWSLTTWKPHAVADDGPHGQIKETEIIVDGITQKP